MDPHVDTIHDAAWRGDLDAVRAMVNGGISPSAPYAAFLGSMETPLLLASENGHLPLIDFLIDECRVDVDREQDADGAGALHYACNGRSTAAVAHLLQRHKANPMCYDRDTGETPLTAAAAHGPPAIVRLLLDDGRSDVEAPRRGRRGGQTAILLAARGKQWASVEMLLDHRADPTVVWPGRASFLKRTLADFASADPTCPPELLARIQASVADGQRAELLHRLRFLSDGAAAATAGASSTASTTASVSSNASSAGAGALPTTARQTRGAKARRIVKRVPPCLAARVHRRKPMPRVDMVALCGEEEGQGGVANTGKGAGKRAWSGGPSSEPQQQPACRSELEEDDEKAKTEREQLRAVAAHVVQGGMVGEHVKEVLEMMAPLFIHRREEARRARMEEGKGKGGKGD